MARDTGLQSQVQSYQGLKNDTWFCLSTLSIRRYILRVKWSNPEKEVTPYPIPRYSSYWKESLYIYIYIYKSSRGISIYDNVITMTRKFGTHSHATYGKLYSCFDQIWSHQQCIPWSPLQEIEPPTTVCKAESLPLGHRSMPHISDAKSTSHGYRAAS